MPQASVLASFLLLSLTVVAVSSVSAPDAFVRADKRREDSSKWFEELDKPVRHIRTEERADHIADHIADYHADETSGDEQLVINDRAGTHIFRMHHGRAVSAQLGVNRVYTVRETFFASQVCTCDLRRRPGHRRVCLKRFKPVFYALVALASLLSVLGLAMICWLVARAVRTRRRCAAVRAAAMSPFSDRRSLMAAEIWGGSGQKLTIQCDPMVWDGGNFQKIAI